MKMNFDTLSSGILSRCSVFVCEFILFLTVDFVCVFIGTVFTTQKSESVDRRHGKFSLNAGAPAPEIRNHTLFSFFCGFMLQRLTNLSFHHCLGDVSFRLRSVEVFKIISVFVHGYCSCLHPR